MSAKIDLYSNKPSVKTKRIAIGLAVTGSILLLFILIASHGIATPLVAAIGHLLIGAFGTAGSLTLTSLLLVGGLLANNSESANPGSVREFFRGLKVALQNMFTFGTGRKNTLREKNSPYIIELAADKTDAAERGYPKTKKPSPWIRGLGIGLAVFAAVSLLALIIASHGVATPLLAAIGHGWIGAFGLKGSFVLSSLLLAGGSLSASSESAYPGSIKRFFNGITSSILNMFTFGKKAKALQIAHADIKHYEDYTTSKGVTKSKHLIFSPAAKNAAEYAPKTFNGYEKIYSTAGENKEIKSTQTYRQRLFS